MVNKTIDLTHIFRNDMLVYPVKYDADAAPVRVVAEIL